MNEIGDSNILREIQSRLQLIRYFNKLYPQFIRYFNKLECVKISL
jgi:hypothetical protein